MWRGHRKSPISRKPGGPRGEMGKLTGPQQTDEARLKRLHRYPGSCPRQPPMCPKGHTLRGLAFHPRGPLDPRGPLYSSRASPPGGEVEPGREREAASSRETLFQLLQTPNSRESRRL